MNFLPSVVPSPSPPSSCCFKFHFDILTASSFSSSSLLLVVLCQTHHDWVFYCIASLQRRTLGPAPDTQKNLPSHSLALLLLSVFLLLLPFFLSIARFCLFMERASPACMTSEDEPPLLLLFQKSGLFIQISDGRLPLLKLNHPFSWSSAHFSTPGFVWAPFPHCLSWSPFLRSFDLPVPMVVISDLCLELKSKNT